MLEPYRLPGIPEKIFLFVLNGFVQFSVIATCMFLLFAVNLK